MTTLSKEANDLKTDFDTMVKNLNTLVNSLNGQWEGAAQKEFATAYSKLKPKLTTISKVLDTYSTAVKQVAVGEEKTESATTASINNLSF